MADTPRRPFRPSRDQAPSAAVVRRDGDEIRPSGPRPVARPDLPEDLEVRLPRGLRRAIDNQVRDEERSRDVQKAMTLAAAMLDEGLGAEAVPLLAWAKSQASRVADVREALGVAHYQAGQWREAVNELRTYRRMAADQGQNHLIADSVRALGGSVEEVAAEIQPQLEAEGLHPERVVEGLLVWAGALRDAGDLPGARAVLRRADTSLLDRAGDEPRQRWTWLAADLAAADGDNATARRLWSELARLPDDPWDAGPALAQLDA